MELIAQGKYIPTDQVKYLLRQGENYTTTLDIILQKQLDGISLAGFAWQVRGVSVEHQAIELEDLTAVPDERGYSLCWVVREGFTAHEGPLSLILVGVKGGQIVKYLFGPMNVVAENVEEYAPSTDYFERLIVQLTDLLYQSREAASDASDSELHAAASKNEAQKIKNTMRPQFDVQAKKVGVKFPDESAYVYTADLTGPQGMQGIQGIQGIQGPTGAQGPKGSTGAAGAQGADGEKGEPGDKGEPGNKGDRGESGVMFTAAGFFGLYVSAAGDLMLLYNDGDTPPDVSIDTNGNLILTLI